MILLIFNTSGISLYYKEFNDNTIKLTENEIPLLTGLISAIAQTSQYIFKEDIVEFFIGKNRDKRITIIVNENYSTGKSVYFVFLSNSEFDIKTAKGLATAIFIQAKSLLINGESNLTLIKNKLDAIIRSTGIRND